jgi:hypothetical protein
MQPKWTYPHNCIVARVFEREESPLDIKCKFMEVAFVVFPDRESEIARLQKNTACPLES